MPECHVLIAGYIHVGEPVAIGCIERPVALSRRVGGYAAEVYVQVVEHIVSCGLYQCVVIFKAVDIVDLQRVSLTIKSDARDVPKLIPSFDRNILDHYYSAVAYISCLDSFCKVGIILVSDLCHRDTHVPRLGHIFNSVVLRPIQVITLGRYCAGVIVRGLHRSLNVRHIGAPALFNFAV